jgi:WD40 repeat protein
LQCSTDYGLSPRYRLYFADETTLVAPAPLQQRLRFWSLTLNRALPPIDVRRDGTIMVVSPTGRYLAVTEAYSHDVDIWDLTSSTLIKTLSPDPALTLHGAVFTWDERLLWLDTIGRGGNGGRFYDTSAWKMLDVQLGSGAPRPGWIMTHAIEHSPQFFVSDANQALLVHRQSGSWTGSNGAVAPSGRYIALASPVERVRIYDVQASKVAHVLPEPGFLASSGADKQQFSVAFSSDGRWLATSTLRSIRLWDAQTFTPGPLLLDGETIDWPRWVQLGIGVCGLVLFALIMLVRRGT